MRLADESGLFNQTKFNKVRLIIFYNMTNKKLFYTLQEGFDSDENAFLSE